MSDAPLLISNSIWDRIEKKYSGYFETRDADVGLQARLVLTALIRARREHTYEIDAASLILDVGLEPFPLHVVSPYMTDAERKLKEAAISACGNEVWVWYTDESMPSFMPFK